MSSFPFFSSVVASSHLIEEAGSFRKRRFSKILSYFFFCIWSVPASALLDHVPKFHLTNCSLQCHPQGNQIRSAGKKGSFYSHRSRLKPERSWQKLAREEELAVDTSGILLSITFSPHPPPHQHRLRFQSSSVLKAGATNCLPCASNTAVGFNAHNSAISMHLLCPCKAANRGRSINFPLLNACWGSLAIHFQGLGLIR